MSRVEFPKGQLHYQPPSLLFNRHVETIFPALFRKVILPAYTRQRIATADGDFLDLDWIKNQSTELVIISHGLEGNSSRAYVKGMAKIFDQTGMDILAWNYRGCSEEPNHLKRFYHSGATDDLDCVVHHAIAQGYEKIYLIGFSLGGNLTLKYLGEHGQRLAHQVKKAVTFSVPLHLHSSCLQIAKSENRIYTYRFLTSLKYKVRRKAMQYPELDLEPLSNISSVFEFDDYYTAPLHGFKNAIDYYERNSACYFLPDISIPTLIVNAKNDPFLSEECYLHTSINDHIHFEMPERGGHVGFSLFNQNGIYWSELRAHHFITT